MISFRIGTDYLDVEVGMQISLTLVNPLFSREIGYGSHSLSFSVPLNPKNRRLLGFRDHLSITSYSNEVEVEVLLGGVFWKTGTLKVISVSPSSEKISVAFNLDTSWLSDKVNTIQLAGMNLGGTRTISTVGTVGGTFEIRVDAGPTQVIAIQINETLYTYTSVLGNTKQELVDELKDQINADSNINATATTQANGSHWQLVISPIDPDDDFQVIYDIGATDIQWYKMSYLSSHQNKQNAMLNHMDTVSAASVGTYDYTFPVIYNPLFFGDVLGDEYCGFINSYEPGNGHQGPFPGVDGAYYSVCIPFVSVKYLVSQGLSQLGLRDVSSFTSTAKYEAMHISNNVPLINEGLFEGIVGSSATGLVGYYDNSFTLNNHLPSEMTLLDLFKDLSEIFNLAIIVDPVLETIDFVERKDSITATKNDWTNKSLVTYTITYADSQSVKYSYAKDDKDKFFDDGAAFEDIDPGNTKHHIEVQRAPLFEKITRDPEHDTNWLTPTIKQQGHTTVGGLEPVTANARYLYFHGLQDNDNGDEYPLGSSKGKDYGGTQLITPSLEWTGTKGLYAQQHEDFEPLLYPTRHINQEFIIDLVDILKLDWTSVYEFRDRHSHHQAVLKKLVLPLRIGERFPIKAAAENNLT